MLIRKPTNQPQSIIKHNFHKEGYIIKHMGYESDFSNIRFVFPPNKS